MLDLYRKQREYMNINQVILRPWQQSLLEYMKPSDREIIWVIGKKVMRGKHGFRSIWNQNMDGAKSFVV